MADHTHHLYVHSLYPEMLDRTLWIAILAILTVTVTVSGMFLTF